MEHFFNGLGITVGVIAGVIAGTLVTTLINYLYFKRIKRQQEDCLRFELKFNIEKIKGFLAEIRRYRDAVNGDALKKYFGYFDLSRILYTTTDKMFSDGELYRLSESTEDFLELQNTYRYYTINAENDFNNSIKRNTEICGTTDWQKEKPEIASFITYREKDFITNIKTLECFLKKIDKKKK